MQPAAFHHVALNCRDPLAVERFYVEHLGFERARVIPLGTQQIVFLRSGKVRLELFPAEGGVTDRPTDGDGPHGHGVRHLAFQVEDVDAKLAEMGEGAKVTLGPLSFDDFIPGWKTAWIADPEGNVVEISQGYADERAESRA